MRQRFLTTLVAGVLLSAVFQSGVSADRRTDQIGVLSADEIIDQLKRDCDPAAGIPEAGITHSQLPVCLQPPPAPATAVTTAGAIACADHPVDINAFWVGDPRWMSGSPIVGGETFFGSLGKATLWTIPTSITNTEFVPVEIRFDGDSTFAQVFRVDQAYNAWGVGIFPGTVWDISDTLNPRQLNVCFAEWDDNTGPVPPPDFYWNPDTTTGPPSFGKWEFLYVMKSSYDGNGLTYAGGNIFKDTLDVLYGWYPRVEPGHTLLESIPAKLVVEVFDEFLTDEFAVADDAKLTLNWTYCGAGNQTGFRIARGINPSSLTEIATTGPTEFTYVDSGLVNNQTYYYKIAILGPNSDTLGFGTVFNGTPRIIASNVDMLGHWTTPGASFGDIWGYTDPGTSREYALICDRNSGAYIVDIDQSPPQAVAFLPSSGWDPKDIKIYQHYAILLPESGPIEFFDITNVSSPAYAGWIWPDGNGSHNCLVEGDYLYVVGNHAAGGLEIFNLAGLPGPVIKVGEFQLQYYHDLDIRNDTVYAAAIYYGGGVDVINVSNKAFPTYITNFNYPSSGAHNCELSQDGKYVFVGDEIGGSGNHTRAFDVSSVGSITQVDDYLILPGAIVHNCYVVDKLLYIAHYALGLRVWDVTDPANGTELGFYDTYPATDYTMNGAWSVYPYFASGRLIVSDMLSGLYVLEYTGLVPTCDCSCHADPQCDGVVNVLDAVSAVQQIFQGVSSIKDPTCDHLSRIDVNCDCTENILDLVMIVQTAFQGAPPPNCDPCTQPCP